MVTNGSDFQQQASMQSAVALLSRPFDASPQFEGTAAERGANSYSEDEDWKKLESEWAKYYRKWKPPEEVSSWVAGIMKLEREWIPQLPPERRKHARGASIELAGVLSEKENRKRAGIAEPVVSLKQAIAESRESVKQYYIATRGDTEDQANKRVDAFLKRQDTLIAKWQAEGMSDREIAEILCDCNEADRRYVAKLDAKSHEHSADRGQTKKARTPEEAAQEFAKHVPKLPTDPKELAKRPTGHPDGHFHPGSTGLSQANLDPRGHSSSRG